jgi:formylmethanofuran dehydrogenase subunit E
MSRGIWNAAIGAYEPEDELIECHECGEKFTEDNMTKIKDVHYVCEDCSSNYKPCQECGVIFDEYSLEAGLCSDCFSDVLDSL